LRLLLAGYNSSDSNTGQDCNSAARRALINNWSNLFQNGCTGDCSSIRHFFRPGDLSGTTETLIAALGLEPPKELAWRPVYMNATTVYFENWLTKERTWDRPICLSWSKRTIESSYWVNTVNYHTQRDTPDVIGFVDDRGQRYYVNPVTKQPTWEAPVNAKWVEKQSEKHEGRSFYFNEATQESTWTQPEDAPFSWVKVHDEVDDTDL
jgi:hypothetical protein